ncbi:MAG TPA: hypothetical protein VKF62_08690, partial [Planctomycetota bacterium]|nr:hypothetical protein [Planctomycetota bacterium]
MAPPPERDRPPWSWRVDGLFAALAFAATFSAFANSLPNGFVRDDVPILRDNPRLEDPWNLGALLGTPYWGEERPNARLYRPLALWTHALDRAVFGPGPLGAHLVNVVGASFLSALVYAFLFRLTGLRALALIASLLYGLHPVHAEVVANGVGRSDIGAAVAALGALLLNLDSVWTDGSWKTGRLRFGGALLLSLASLGFKESAVTLPLLAFGMEAWVLDPVRGGRPPGRLLRLALYALPLGAYLAARWAVVGSGPPTVPETLAGATGLQRRLHGCETLLLYLGQLALPLRLCGEYEDFTRLIRPSLAEPRVLASLLLWPAVALLCIRLARRGKLVPVYAAAWFFLGILPASNLLFTIGTVRAERLLFFPSLGFALALACLLHSLRRIRRILPVAALLPILGFYGWQTVRRNADWRSEESFLEVTLRQNPGNPRLWYSLGDARLRRGDAGGAEDALRRSIALHESAGFFP